MFVERPGAGAPLALAQADRRRDTDQKNSMQTGNVQEERGRA